MKQRIAIVLIIVPMLFCFLKGSGDVLNVLNVVQLQFCIIYACFGFLLWSRKNSTLFIAAIFNWLLSIFCLYVFLPPVVVGYLSFLSHPVYCIMFMLVLSFVIQKFISTKIA